MKKQIYNRATVKDKIIKSFQPYFSTFEKVWNDGLLFTIKNILISEYYKILKSYLADRQKSVMGPLLYLIFTADLPDSPSSTGASFADDTAILLSYADTNITSEKLQTH